MASASRADAGQREARPRRSVAREEGRGGGEEGVSCWRLRRAGPPEVGRGKGRSGHECRSYGREAAGLRGLQMEGRLETCRHQERDGWRASACGEPARPGMRALQDDKGRRAPRAYALRASLRLRSRLREDPFSAGFGGQAGQACRTGTPETQWARKAKGGTLR